MPKDGPNHVVMAPLGELSRLRKMAQGYGQGVLRWHDINPRVQSWLGHAAHADTRGLRRAIFANTVFTRG